MLDRTRTSHEYKTHALAEGLKSGKESKQAVNCVVADRAVVRHSPWDSTQAPTVAKSLPQSTAGTARRSASKGSLTSISQITDAQVGLEL